MAGRRASKLSIPLRRADPLDSSGQASTSSFGGSDTSSMASTSQASGARSARQRAQPRTSTLASIFASTQARRRRGDEDEDEEKTSPEKQELVRMVSEDERQQLAAHPTC